MGPHNFPRGTCGAPLFHPPPVLGSDGVLHPHGFVGIALLLASLSVAVSVSNALAADDAWVIERHGRPVAVMQTLAPGLVILAGLAVSVRIPIIGGMLALVGTAVFSVMMWWTVIVPILALLLVWSAVARAQELRVTA